MDDRSKLLRQCSKIVGVICVLFILVDLVDGAYAGAAILFLFGAGLLVPVFAGLNKLGESFLCIYFCIGLNIVVCVVTMLERDYIACIPLFICAGTISAIFFDTRLVKISFLSAILLFLMEMTILSLLSGDFIMDPFVIAECTLGMATCFFLVHRCVSNGLDYMSRSNANEEKSQNLLNTVNKQIEDVKIASDKSRHILEEVHQASADILTGADKLTAGSSSLALGATQQTVLIGELQETIETISSKIKETAEYARGVRTEAGDMSVNVDMGSRKMDDMLLAVEEIRKSSLSIEKIIKAIEDIAFQTNILALNASVEAARAGEAGKGFAVVADEVRDLASKSAQAAGNTTELLRNCLTAIANGSKIASETASALEQIGSSVNEVSAKTSMISDMTDGQASMVGEINQKILQVSDVIQSIANSAKETETAGVEFQNQAEKLENLCVSI